MCESTAVLITKDGEKKLMEYVVDVVPQANGKVFLAGLLGDEQVVDGYLKEIKLLDHKIIIQQA